MTSARYSISFTDTFDPSLNLDITENDGGGIITLTVGDQQNFEMNATDAFEMAKSLVFLAERIQAQDRGEE